MKKSTIGLVACVAMIFAISLSLQITPGSPSPTKSGENIGASAWTTTPITIDSHDDFHTYSSGGDGTALTPFIIEYFQINYTSDDYPAINNFLIKDTTDYFILQHCEFWVGRSTLTRTGCGLSLENVQNGQINDVSIWNQPSSGIQVIGSSSSNLLIENCHVEADYMWGGISIAASASYVDLENNYIEHTNGGGLGGVYVATYGIGSLPTYVTMNDNTLVKCSFGTLEPGANLLTYDIDTTNTVNGDPLYYIMNAVNGAFPTNTPVGQLLLLNCDGYTVDSVSIPASAFGYTVGLFGVGVLFSTDISITNSYFADFGAAIAIMGSSYVTVDTCTFSGYMDNGIYVAGSTYSTITNNVLSNIVSTAGNDTAAAIKVESSSSTIISLNTIENNDVNGILLAAGADSNEITYNTITGSDESGIWIVGDSNVIHYNTIEQNKFGVYIAADGASNDIWLNDFISNTGTGLSGCSQAFDDGSNNHWYSSTRGNYWSDYEARYPSAKKHLGIWSLPYEIDGAAGSSDAKPLVNHYYDY